MYASPSVIDLAMRTLSTPAISLVAPHVKYRDSYLAGFGELTSDDERLAWLYLGMSAPLDTAHNDFDAYVSTLLRRRTVPPPGFVCDTVLWAILDDELVGRISLRHELNDFLSRWGGHIGYIVRPSYRRRGIATEMLRQMLRTQGAKDIGRLLITCDEGNVASEKTIISNGGVYESTIAVEAKHGLPKKRFWITSDGL